MTMTMTMVMETDQKAGEAFAKEDEKTQGCWCPEGKGNWKSLSTYTSSARLLCFVDYTKSRTPILVEKL